MGRLGLGELIVILGCLCCAGGAALAAAAGVVAYVLSQRKQA